MKFAAAMSMLLALLATPLEDSSAAGLETGSLLTYQGEMVADRGEGGLARKVIELSVLVSQVDSNGATLWWTLSQEGRGEWPWPDRFGQMQLDARYKMVGAGAPALLYQRDNGQSIVTLAPPVLVGPQPLKEGLSWKEGRNELRVTGQANKADRRTWRVEATTPYGRNRTLWVDTQSPLVVSLKRTIFIGQGEKHQLKLKLTEARQLSPDELAATLDGYTALARLRDLLGHKPRSAVVTWNSEQLSELRAELPAVLELLKTGPLVEVAKAAREDAKDQKDRSGAVSFLRERALGRSMNGLKLSGPSGEMLSLDDLKGDVTVLHLWGYQDRPLEEPYGQVGYLDYLYRQRKADGLRVYGVVVDPRLADPSARQLAVRGARKLKAFMNLSYPLLLDEGALIQKLGDPRITGAKLPLYVVIGRDGKVLEYHSGLYEVTRDQGLKQLDALVTQALGSGE